MSTPLLLIIEDDETISLSLKVFFESKHYAVLVESTEGAASVQPSGRSRTPSSSTFTCRTVTASMS